MTGDIVGLALSSSTGLSELIVSGVVSHVTLTSVSVAYDGQHDMLLELNNSAHYKLVKLANDVTYRRMLRLNLVFCCRYILASNCDMACSKKNDKTELSEVNCCNNLAVIVITMLEIVVLWCGKLHHDLPTNFIAKAVT